MSDENSCSGSPNNGVGGGDVRCGAISDDDDEKTFKCIGSLFLKTKNEIHKSFFLGFEN